MSQEQAATQDRVEIRYPPRFNVVIYNDNNTPMVFVVRLLIEIFGKSTDEATDIMMNIHESGKGIAGTFTNEIASQKAADSNRISTTNGYPLKTKVEKID